MTTVSRSTFRIFKWSNYINHMSHNRSPVSCSQALTTLKTSGTGPPDALIDNNILVTALIISVLNVANTPKPDNSDWSTFLTNQMHGQDGQTATRPQAHEEAKPVRSAIPPTPSQQGKWYIFGKIAMRSYFLQKLALATISNSDLQLTPRFDRIKT